MEVDEAIKEVEKEKKWEKGIRNWVQHRLQACEETKALKARQ